MGGSQNEDAWETMARMVAHPLRSLLLFKYTECVTSPSAIAKELGERLNVVSHHTRVLRDAGVIELVREESRRGATVHFYRATLASEIDDADWERLPISLRRLLVRRMIDGAMSDAADALPRGGMDVSTTHMSRSYLYLDEHGRSELASVLRGAFVQARDIDTASRARKNDDTVPYALVVMSFERASGP
jgi:DNA-binding transcriptional ArsR family regulator